MNAISETKTIGGIECYGRKKAAEYIGVSLSTIDRMVRLSKAGRAKVKLRFIQIAKSAPIWFPKESLDSFVLEVMDKGRAV